MTSPDADGLAALVPPGSASVAGPSQSLIRASIVTPSDWAELDLDPATRHRSIRRSVRRAVRRKRVRQDDAVRLMRYLDELARRAYNDGAFYCASLVLDAGASGSPLVANVMMHLAPYVESPHTIATPAHVCAILTAFLKHDPSTRGVNVSVVGLPMAGPSVRAEMVAGGSVVQYYVPLSVPLHASDRLPTRSSDEFASPPSSQLLVAPSPVVLVTFSCLSPPYVEVMTELFDAMASSLVLMYD